MMPTARRKAPLKVLFLTSKLGYGHTRAADAIIAELRLELRSESRSELARNLPADGQGEPGDMELHTIDLWSLMDERVAEAVKDGYLRMTREHPSYYQKLYDLDVGVWRQLSGEEPAEAEIRDFLSNQQRRWFPRQHNWFTNRHHNLDQALLNTMVNLICSTNERAIHRIILRSILRFIRGVLVNRLKEKLLDIEPDVIVSTQMYPASLVALLKKKNSFRDIPNLGVITDFALHKAWLRPPSEAYCIPCPDLMDVLLGEGVARERIHITGIPVMPQFKTLPEQRDARRELGIPVQRKTILVTGGQYGIGGAEAVETLVDCDADYQILVTTGRSADETGGLTRLATDHPERVRVFNWVEDMSFLLAAADVVVGKPGGLSVSEALACGRPFFATCCLGGQEQRNVEFLTRNGIGALTEARDLPRLLAGVFETDQALKQLQERAYAHGHRHAAQHIARLVLDLWQGQGKSAEGNRNRTAVKEL